MPGSFRLPSLAPLAAAVALAGPGSAGATPVSVAEEVSDQVLALKTAYLRCEDLAQKAALGSSDIARCSEIYETLKRQVFDGNAAALRAWYKRVNDLPSK